MNTDQLRNAAFAAMGPQVVKRARWSWLAYGVVAYVGVKYLSKRGLLPKQADAVLDVVDQGIETLKKQFGFGSSEETASSSFQGAKKTAEAASQSLH